MGIKFSDKKHWKYPSKIEYLHAGLKKFLDTYKEKGIQSIAFPLLGADKGGIPQDKSLNIMRTHLDKADLNVEIYRYDAGSADDLYKKLKEWLLLQDINSISKATGLRKDYVLKLIDAIQLPNVVQLNQLVQINGIGIKTLEKIFNLARSSLIVDNVASPEQQSLV